MYFLSVHVQSCPLNVALVFPFYVFLILFLLIHDGTLCLNVINMECGLLRSPLRPLWHDLVSVHAVSSSLKRRRCCARRCAPRILVKPGWLHPCEMVSSNARNDRSLSPLSQVFWDLQKIPGSAWPLHNSMTSLDASAWSSESWRGGSENTPKRRGRKHTLLVWGCDQTWANLCLLDLLEEFDLSSPFLVNVWKNGSAQTLSKLICHPTHNNINVPPMFPRS